MSGPYRGRSVVFKALERRADHVFEPEGGEGPVYLIEIQARRSGDVYDRLVREIALYRWRDQRWKSRWGRLGGRENVGLGSGPNPTQYNFRE